MSLSDILARKLEGPLLDKKGNLLTRLSFRQLTELVIYYSNKEAKDKLTAQTSVAMLDFYLYCNEHGDESMLDAEAREQLKHILPTAK